MSDALEHSRYSCVIAGEEVANYVDQLQAKVAELEAEREDIKQALTSAYYVSGLPIAYSVGELVAGYKDRNKSAQEPEIIGSERYRVEKTGHGFWPYCVRAGTGSRELFVGHQKQCTKVANALATAFEDGKFVATTPLPTDDVVRDALKQQRDELLAALEKFLDDNNPEGFGCACEPGRLCGPCSEAERQRPLYAAIASVKGK